MVIAKKYLVVNTDENAPEKQVVAKDEEGSFLFKLNIKKSETGVPFYLDVKRFIGKEVFFYCGKEEFHFDAQSDNADLNMRSNEIRPKLHYTVPYGWLNDPNGLIFVDGKFHIFCQHNPLSASWGNMHWYHSTTKDFIHFEHLGDALFPDEFGTMFSGSAICDKENKSELGKNVVLLYYTIAEYSRRFHKPKFSQGLAYSYDGVHFEKYYKNPIVPNIKGENRDPKVVFVPELDAYIMALYLDSDEYCFLKSNDLINWDFFQTIHIEGDSECPDLCYYGECKKWVLSGAADCYIVGHFEKEGFIKEQNALRFYNELDGRLSYAAQSFSGCGDRVLRLSWENINPGKQCFCGQLSVALEMSAVNLKNGEIRLCAKLCREISDKLSLYKSGGASSYLIDSATYIADIIPKDDLSVSIDGAILNISITNNTISYKKRDIPFTINGNKSIRFIVDKMSIEILSDDGLIFSALKHIYDKEKRCLTVSGGEAQIKIYIPAE